MDRIAIITQKLNGNLEEKTIGARPVDWEQNNFTSFFPLHIGAWRCGSTVDSMLACLSWSVIVIILPELPLLLSLYWVPENVWWSKDGCHDIDHIIHWLLIDVWNVRLAVYTQCLKARERFLLHFIIPVSKAQQIINACVYKLIVSCVQRVKMTMRI